MADVINVVLNAQKQKELTILEQFGFDRFSPMVVKTLTRDVEKPMPG